MAALSLAYYLTGLNMILFHTGLDPIDQPRYASAGVLRILGAATVWPFVANINGELGWFGLFFASGLLYFTVALRVVVFFVDSPWIVLGVFWVLCFTPIVGAPVGILGSLLWRLLPASLRPRMPSRMGEVFARWVVCVKLWTFGRGLPEPPGVTG
jgi:hypothetical protein